MTGRKTPTYLLTYVVLFIQYSYNIYMHKWARWKMGAGLFFVFLVHFSLSKDYFQGTGILPLLVPFGVAIISVFIILPLLGCLCVLIPLAIRPASLREKWA